MARQCDIIRLSVASGPSGVDNVRVRFKIVIKVNYAEFNYQDLYLTYYHDFNYTVCVFQYQHLIFYFFNNLINFQFSIKMFKFLRSLKTIFKTHFLFFNIFNQKNIFS